MREIILATSNKGKLEEFNEMAKKLNVKFVTIDMPYIEENGINFEENSYIKAKTISEYTNKVVLADDSGLEVEALDNKPGVHTARYMDHLPEYKDRCKALIKEVDKTNSKNRNAKFVCVLTLVFPDGRYYHFRGETKGLITKKLEGTNGHGYDPVFYSFDLKKTFGMASIEEKDSVSHRARAFEKFKEFIND
ncbi:RdgB/HAM1 family non-canonical purine NTP pyrophosphatase [Oceanivirga salmonicida]|uniref:RdgB/HAM1 family non-canonical purine NTP pyrophosphatase n=1 Tax=Oceanivirga salmonicida TaxID=1769291 RepID=UPI0012E2C6A3|nr:RdgB/HAM1 family non-canonical purine NTP pyrophosphatase [Oceanivirga salmonicida]